LWQQTVGIFSLSPFFLVFFLSLLQERGGKKGKKKKKGEKKKRKEVKECEFGGCSYRCYM
jgi:hypothetical protein